MNFISPYHGRPTAPFLERAYQDALVESLRLSRQCFLEGEGPTRLAHPAKIIDDHCALYQAIERQDSAEADHVARKGAGKEAKLCHMGHLMMENRNGLIVDARVTEANGTAERETALDMIEDNARPGSTVGGDKNYRLRGRTPRTRLHAACLAEQYQPALGDRWANDPTFRLSSQHHQP